MLVSERMLNLPPELAPSLLTALVDDVAWACGHGGGVGWTGLTSLLCVAPRFSERGEGPAPPPSLRLGAGWSTHYLHFEEELFAAHASLSFSFPVADIEVGGAGGAGAPGGGGKKRDRESNGRPALARTVLLFPFSALAQCSTAAVSMLGAATAAAAAATEDLTSPHLVKDVGKAKKPRKTK